MGFKNLTKYVFTCYVFIVVDDDMMMFFFFKIAQVYIIH